MQQGYSAVEVKLISLTGQVLWQHELRNKTAELDLSQFPAGVYLIHTTAYGRQSKIKLVKNR